MAQTYWSKLEDAGDVTSPETGPAGTEDGSPDYAACKFNNGICVNANAEGYYFPNNPTVITAATKGAVEFWIKTDYNVANGLPADAAHHMLVVYNPAGSAQFWCYINSDNGIGMLRDPDTGSGDRVTVFDTTSDWTAGDLVHLAFVWDAAAGFDESKTMAVYVNGVQTASTTTALGTFTDTTDDVYVGEQDSQINPMDSIMDNIKIHDTTKTDFTDRDYEDGVIPSVAFMTPKKYW